ncbi:SUN domain-containing ossification factor-like isoform X1 [Haliotis cracherodii]|uniref:SUN domain-containing ossification factor-like isoform X1 n=1 Tax=Haliotis cracherodii TaxID=6455 RepID=UPI0039E9E340
MRKFSVSVHILVAVLYFQSVRPQQAGESTDGSMSLNTGVHTGKGESITLQANSPSASPHITASMNKPESTSVLAQPSVVITADSSHQQVEASVVAVGAVDSSSAAVASDKVHDPSDQRGAHTQNGQDHLKTDAIKSNVEPTESSSQKEKLASQTESSNSDDVQQKQHSDHHSSVTTNETLGDKSKDEALPASEDSSTVSLSEPELSVDTRDMSGGSKVDIRDKVATDNQQDFQSYTEWRQKVLEEEQKSKQDNTIPVVSMPVPLKSKQRINFSSKNCGAKVLASNQEAENVQGVLTGNKDEYMLNPCGAQKKWFAIELCEPIQVKTVEIASLELFSSQPKTFRVSLSDRFPAKDWRELGEYEATQEKTAQAFQVDDQQFVKFVKVELLSHYSNEHFCPVTLFRVFGVPMADDDDDNNENIESTNSEDETVILQDGDEDEAKDNSRNLFMSAKDTVMNLVKKVLNVDEAEQSTTGNPPSETDVVGGNYSHDGYLLPCVPEADTKVGEMRWESSGDVPTVTVPLPSSQAGPTDLPIVTKLQDDEQIPSEHSGNENLVTLLSSQYPGAVEICTTPSQHNKTSPHRMVCSYIQTMLSNKITQTCSSQLESTVAPSSRQKTDTSTRTLSDTSSTPVADTTLSQSWMEESPVPHTTERSANTAGSFSLQETQADKGDRSISAHKISTDDDDSKKSVPDTTTDTLVVKTQSITGIKTKESVTVTLEAEQDFSKPSESSPSVSSSQQENEVVPHLKPSSTPSFVEDSHKLTHTPVLETQQPSTSDTQAEDLGKTSVSSKVSPSPAVVVSSSVDTLPTKVIATMLDEEVDEHKDSPGQESDVTESVVKAENITANKDKPLDLMQVPLAPVAKRETAIMRLTNRIKALELNVSLSSRFLDELSHRFKKQSEDMMRLLNKTIAHFNNVTGRTEVKDTLQQEQLEKLESRVENLTALMTELSISMEDLNNKITDRQLVWTTVEFFLLGIVCIVCLRRGGSPSIHPDVRHLLEMMPSHPNHTASVRRNSVGAVGSVLSTTPMRKQASESALAAAIANEYNPSFEIVEQGNSLLSQQPVQKDGNKKKKKKKHKNLEPKSSTEAVSPEGSDSLSATQLTESAGLLFGADALTVLTGIPDPSCTIAKTTDEKSTSHRMSTKSLPTHSRQSSQSFIEIHKNPSNVTVLPKKLSLPNSGSQASQCISHTTKHSSCAPPSGLKAHSLHSLHRLPTHPPAGGTVQAASSVLAGTQVKTLANGAMCDSKPVSGRTSAHMWKSTGQHKPVPPPPPPPPPQGGTRYPGLKGTKSNPKQKSWSFKKSIGFE